MWTATGPKLLEYNVRFGDPETQVLMALLDEDLAELLLEVAQGRLARTELKFRPGCALTVVLAAEDYPAGAKKGVPMTIGALDGVTVIHAGTRRTAQGWATNGGRVLNLVATAADLQAARARAAEAVTQVRWPGMQCRSDIGLRALNHAAAGRTVADPFL
jgi:phosphoribosylamine-glycine ligase